jgi:hypothetical protein
MFLWNAGIQLQHHKVSRCIFNFQVSEYDMAVGIRHTDHVAPAKVRINFADKRRSQAMEFSFFFRSASEYEFDTI